MIGEETPDEAFFFLLFSRIKILQGETESQRHQLEAVTINQHSAQGVKAAQAGVWESERRQSQLISAGSVLLERSAGPRRSSSSTLCSRLHSVWGSWCAVRLRAAWLAGRRTLHGTPRSLHHDAGPRGGISFERREQRSA